MFRDSGRFEDESRSKPDQSVDDLNRYVRVIVFLVACSIYVQNMREPIHAKDVELQTVEHELK